jgi:phosphoribosylformimino-5-aminoimidazole carboxamide ribotide isomerase
MRIIVAIDILDGKCVRLTKGDFSTGKVYSEDPVKTALQLADNGIKYLHIVDLDGARNKKIKNLHVVENIASRTDLVIDFGGGIRSDEDIRNVLNAGAKQITAGSIAVTDSVLFMKWLEDHGPERIVLGADHRNGIISVSGWIDSSDRDVVSFLSDYQKKGVKYAICTDIERDGTLMGPSVDLYRQILSGININLIASGGISSLRDIDEVRKSGCEGVIIGKAFYEGRITLKELAEC